MDVGGYILYLVVSINTTKACSYGGYSLLLDGRVPLFVTYPLHIASA